MFRQCERQNCTHYALHVVSSTRRGSKIQVCHLDVLWATGELLRGNKWSRIEVTTSSEVVVGDIRAWRTRSITAYDESRQIKGA